MLSSKASKFVTRWVRCTMVTARSAHPTNCSPCVLTAAKPSGVPLRKLACGTCETGRREEQNGGGVSDLSDRGNLVIPHTAVEIEKGNSSSPRHTCTVARCRPFHTPFLPKPMRSSIVQVRIKNNKRCIKEPTIPRIHHSRPFSFSRLLIILVDPHKKVLAHF